MTEPVDSTTNVSQADYMRVFMQELAYQDPLKPIDNREFMAQMAQFSALQQASETSANVAKLLDVTYENRGISLLGKSIRATGIDGHGTVEAILFKENKISLRVKPEHAIESTFIDLNQILEISNR